MPYDGSMTTDQERTLLMAHVADAIDRVGGDNSGYDETASMAAEMLDRFPGLGEAAAGYATGTVSQRALDSAVLDALAAF